ncbi:DNA primase [Candidatus Woesearchaeota archaeon]|nr:DNA primase [Candidatus Woesearchaeota archaeon]
MGKISQVSSKYIIHAAIEIEGVVDRPDVIGAIFGQTEGLIGSDLELRELQRSGRIGRIEVNVDTRAGKTQGTIIIPSSLDKAETSIIAAALEVIQRIGPCNAKLKVKNIEDVRISKRKYVIDRAKELLKTMMDDVLPDSQEIADEVAYSVRVMEVQEYGKDRLPAGPAVDESDSIIVVEGRADVLNLLKHGFKNVIAINGTSIPPTIVDLCAKKEVTAFVDGDRGGKLIVQELISLAEIDFVTMAPDGKEVEEITKKEIHKALRSRVAAEQVKMDITTQKENGNSNRTNTVSSRLQQRSSRPVHSERRERPQMQPRPQYAPKKVVVTADEKNKFTQMLNDLVGTRGACLLDESLNILGKVPLPEIETSLKGLSGGVHAVVFDGVIERPVVQLAERSNVKYLVAMDSKVKQNETKVGILTLSDL